MDDKSRTLKELANRLDAIFNNPFRVAALSRFISQGSALMRATLG